MGRAHRQAPADTVFHVTTRGNRRQRVFVDDHDRTRFLSIFGDVVKRLRWSCLAYCLMTNHYHLVVHTPEETLSVGMQRLNGVWAQRFNRRHGFKGHLFERPFRSKIVGDEIALDVAMRYTVLNPVRAGICALPGEWTWSSYRATAGYAPAPAFLDVERVHRIFAEPGKDGRTGFVEFVMAGLV